MERPFTKTHWTPIEKISLWSLKLRYSPPHFPSPPIITIVHFREDTQFFSLVVELLRVKPYKPLSKKLSKKYEPLRSGGGVCLNGSTTKNTLIFACLSLTLSILCIAEFPNGRRWADILSSNGVRTLNLSANGSRGPWGCRA